MRHLNRGSLSLCFALLVVSAACRGGGETGTTTAPGVKVTNVTLGRAIGGDKAITDATDNFRPNDTIYASIATEGSAPSMRLRARWTYQDGQVVDESTQTITPNNRERIEFHISKPDGWPTGNYQLELFADDRSVETKKFEVK